MLFWKNSVYLNSVFVLRGMKKLQCLWDSSVYLCETMT